MQNTQLRTAEVISFSAQQTWIRCESGQFWLSHDGQDIVLECGQKWFISGADKVVLEAFQNSRFSLSKDFSRNTQNNTQCSQAAITT